MDAMTVSLRAVRHVAQTHQDALEKLGPVLRSQTERIAQLEQDVHDLKIAMSGQFRLTDTCWKRLVWLWKGVA
jgi:hypothetical protein